MKNFFLVLIFLIIYPPFAISQEVIKTSGELPEDGTIAKKVYDRVNYILENIKETKYVHSKMSCIDEDNGIYKYDCSGFLGIYVLNNVSKEYCNQLNRATIKGIINKSSPCKVKSNCGIIQNSSTVRPLAENFYYYLREVNNKKYNKYFTVITDFRSVKVSDIIVVKYANSWKKDAKSHCSYYNEDHNKKPSTGHVMIAMSEPVKSKINCIDCCINKQYKNSRCTQHDEYYIKVADSANSAHRKDTNDDLYVDDDHKGISKGTMYFGVNNTGEPIYYRWSNWDSPKYQTYDCDTNCKTSDTCQSPCHTKNKFLMCNNKVSKYDKIDSILIGRIKQ